MVNNHWVGTDGSDDSGNVKYLLSELHLCLGDCQKARGPDELHRLSSNIAMWISDAVLQRPMFKELKGLRGCFTQFSSYEKEDLVDQDRKDKVLLIEELATVDAFTSMPNLENASVSNRTQFRNSKLYANFIEEKVHLILDNGRKEGGDTRSEAIKRSQGFGQYLSEGLKLTVAALATLFDDSQELKTKVQYLVDSEAASGSAKLAIHYDPDGEVGWVAKFLQEDNAAQTTKVMMSYMRYSVFAKVADVFTDFDVDKVIPCPLLQQAVQLFIGFKGTGPDALWQKRLLSATVSARILIDLEDTNLALYDPAQEVASEFESAAFKAVYAFLKFKPVAPEWFDQWKQTFKSALEKK
jgi:hypothetical protein